MYRIHAIGKAGSDQRSFEPALGADAYFPALELRTVAARGGEELLTHGIVDHRVLQPPAVFDRDRDSEGWKAVQEIRRAIEGVDDPEVFALAAAAALLGENCVIRVAAADDGDDLRLGLAVDVRDEVVAALAVDFQGIET